MAKQYGKHPCGGDCIYEVRLDEEGYYDLFVDDIQGDIMVCGCKKEDLTFVTENEYLDRIKMLSGK